MNKCCGLILVVLMPLQVHSGLLDLRIQEHLTNQAKEMFKGCTVALTSSSPCPDDDNIKFKLYTRRNVTSSQRVAVSYSDDDLSRSNFNPDVPNKVIIHGFAPKEYKANLLAIKDAYLTKADVNVWIVNWSRLAANGVCLPLSLANTEHVAECTGQLVAAIRRHSPDSHIHVVAYRVGVKVAHELSQAVKPLRIDRITGISPRGGKIPRGSDIYRLTPGDADFVDTIHTSQLNKEMFGQVDFYVNPHLPHQPGCEKLELGRMKCDQVRALQYFAESITTEVGFLGWKCSGYKGFTWGTCYPQDPLLAMGEQCPVGASGIYLVYTSAESPFALGHWHGEIYKERGPKSRFNLISRSITSIKKTIDQLNEKTPDIVKDIGLVDMVKAELEENADELKGTAKQLGVKGLKALATHVVDTKLKNVGELAEVINDIVANQ